MENTVVKAALSSNVRHYFKLWYDGKIPDKFAIISFIKCLSENIPESKKYDSLIRCQITYEEALDIFYCDCLPNINNYSKVLGWFKEYKENLHF